MNDFASEYGDAMRVGEPGMCYGEPCGTCTNGLVAYGPDVHDCPECGGAPEFVRSYHIFDGDAVRELRSISAGGGLAPCLACGKMIFVPGRTEAGIPVYGLPAPPMRGQEIGELLTDEGIERVERAEADFERRVIEGDVRGRDYRKREQWCARCGTHTNHTTDEHT